MPERILLRASCLAQSKDNIPSPTTWTQEGVWREWTEQMYAVEICREQICESASASAAT